MAGDRARTGAAEKRSNMASGSRNENSDTAGSLDSETAIEKNNHQEGQVTDTVVSQLMIAGRREWGTQVLRTCFYNHDIKDICKIRLSDRMHEDVIA
jgi:hypothetical protein